MLAALLTSALGCGEDTMAGTAGGDGTTVDVGGTMDIMPASDGWASTRPSGSESSDDPCVDVVEGALVLSDQEGVDAARFVRAIEGDLTIEGPVTSLEPLQCLRRIGGALRIVGTELVDLSGLAALDEIGRDLRVMGNEELESLAGLESLRFVSVIYLERNRLRSLGLTQLHGLGHLEIGTCAAGQGDAGLGEPELATLDTLDSLFALESVTVWSSPSLASLAGLTDFANRGGRGVRLSFRWLAALDAAEVDSVASALESPSVETCGLAGEDPEECICPMGPPP